MSRRSIAPRDQSPSGFAAPLGRLCDALGAVAAAVVDPEGETVDYAGSLDPFAIRVVAAELQLLMGALVQPEFDGWSGCREVVIRARGASYAAVALADGYGLVMQLSYRAFSFSRRALNEAIREISEEAALDLPEWVCREHWLRIDVQDDESKAHRPSAVWLKHRWCPVQVLGRYQGAEGESSPVEVGYRVRFDDGQEITMVRERFGRWYADHVLAS